MKNIKTEEWITLYFSLAKIKLLLFGIHQSAFWQNFCNLWLLWWLHRSTYCSLTRLSRFKAGCVIFILYLLNRMKGTQIPTPGSIPPIVTAKLTTNLTHLGVNLLKPKWENRTSCNDWFFKKQNPAAALPAWRPAPTRHNEYWWCNRVFFGEYYNVFRPLASIKCSENGE